MRYISMIAALALTMNATTVVWAERPMTEGAKVGEWTMDVVAAKKLAKEKHLPILINFTGSDWCGWCKLMDKNVFSQEGWKTYATQNLVTVFIDFPRNKELVPEKLVDSNKALSKQFGVQGYPTYILLASDGEKQLGKLGASREATPESFIRDIKKYTEWPAKVAKLNAIDKASYDKAKVALATVQKELESWLEAKPERNEENNKKFKSFMERITACEMEIADIMEKQK